MDIVDDFCDLPCNQYKYVSLMLDVVVLGARIAVHIQPLVVSVSLCPVKARIWVYVIKGIITKEVCEQILVVKNGRHISFA